MRLNKNIVTAALHISAWLLIFTLDYFLARNSHFEYRWGLNVLIILLYTAVFYSTYLFLMPFLFKNKAALFVLLSLVLLAGGITVKSKLDERRFEVAREMFKDFNFNDNGERPKPPMEGFRPENRPEPKVFRSDAMKQMGPEKPKRPVLLGSATLLLFYVLGVSFRFIGKWQDDEKLKNALEKEKISTELQFLKQQINPHFLFNSINSLYSLSLTKSEQTSNAILKLSSILRYMLYESENSLVNLSNEIKTIKDYIDLQKLRLTKLVEVNIDITGKSEGYLIAPFIMIPIIENAFKYGADNINPSFINIYLSVENGVLSLDVANKIVRKNNDGNKDSGIGLQNIKRRLDLLYPNEYTFESKKSNDKFSVYLELKLRK